MGPLLIRRARQDQIRASQFSVNCALSWAIIDVIIVLSLTSPWHSGGQSGQVMHATCAAHTARHQRRLDPLYLIGTSRTGGTNIPWRCHFSHPIRVTVCSKSINDIYYGCPRQHMAPWRHLTLWYDTGRPGSPMEHHFVCVTSLTGTNHVNLTQNPDTGSKYIILIGNNAAATWGWKTTTPLSAPQTDVHKKDDTVCC